MCKMRLMDINCWQSCSGSEKGHTGSPIILGNGATCEIRRWLYYGMLIGSFGCRIEWYHFRWPWVTLTWVSRSLYTYKSNIPKRCVSGAKLQKWCPTYSNGCRNGYFYFRRDFCFLPEFHFRSEFYSRNWGGTSATPHLWPMDHGGRFCATNVARTRHYGRRNELTGRRNEIRLASRVTVTYVTLWVFLNFVLFIYLAYLFNYCIKLVAVGHKLKLF